MMVVKFGFTIVVASGSDSIIDINELAAAIVGLACFASSYTNSVGTLLVTYGILVGYGIAASTWPVLTCISHHTDKNRGLVTGIASAGKRLNN